MAYSAVFAGLSDEADLHIGTGGFGFTHPAAAVPFGFVQAGPDTGCQGWRHSSGYRYEDARILAFSQSHMSGTGGGDLGDVGLMPFVGKGLLPDFAHASSFRHENERAHPGFYSVDLDDCGVKVEIAAAQRAAIYRFTYSRSPARMLVDFAHAVGGQRGRQILASRVMSEEGCRFLGTNRRLCWVERDYSFVVEFDRPWTEQVKVQAAEATERAPTYALSFDLKAGETLMAKVALSSVDAEGARRNLQSEIPGWDFEGVRRRASRAWADAFSPIDVKGGSARDRRIFASALYHLFLQPVDMADADGRYRGADGRVAAASDGRHYTQLSLWDTYRAAHPLYTLLAPERVDGFVSSMIAQWKAIGILPVWSFYGREDACMIGTHSVPVIVDAYLKGFRGFDAETAYEAVRDTLRRTHDNRWKENWPALDRYGYLPYDLVPHESVSRTLEGAYDDACAARFAKALGKTEDEAFFSRRSACWRNLFDRETGFMRARDSEGRWRTPFDPLKFKWPDGRFFDYTEGNAWQWSWSVQHDASGLAEILGGRAAAMEKLNALFALQATGEGQALDANITGLIGQYVHGNEPSHHLPYLFTLYGDPSRTVELVREIRSRFYSDRPDGLCGNEDCGQMSAWYVFSAFGFYPVDPCGGDYVLGVPLFPEVALRLPSGKTLRIVARGLSERRWKVGSVSLNGRRIAVGVIRHAEIAAGGDLVFEMTE